MKTFKMWQVVFKKDVYSFSVRLSLAQCMLQRQFGINTLEYFNSDNLLTKLNAMLKILFCHLSSSSAHSQRDEGVPVCITYLILTTFQLKG